MSEVREDWHKRLPRRIAIGAYTFRIEIVAPENPKLEGHHGMSLLNEFRILLPDDLPFQRCAEVVQHELCHCINWVYGVDDDSTEEHFTTQSSRGWIDLRLRNPRLDTWMGQILRRMRKEALK